MVFSFGHRGAETLGLRIKIKILTFNLIFATSRSHAIWHYFSYFMLVSALLHEGFLSAQSFRSSRVIAQYVSPSVKR